MRASRIGFAPQTRDVTVPAGGTVNVEFGIAPQAAVLSDIVVTGYGTQRRESITGSVATVNAEEANVGVVTNVEMRMTSGPEGLFRRMNDPGVHIVAYSGHADYGRNVQRQIEGGSPLIGSKVFFGLQCGGHLLRRAAKRN